MQQLKTQKIDSLEVIKNQNLKFRPIISQISDLH